VTLAAEVSGSNRCSQWLAYLEADPTGAHLQTMQALFRRAIGGESIFRSEEDWNAYSKGYTGIPASGSNGCHSIRRARLW